MPGSPDITTDEGGRCRRSRSSTACFLRPAGSTTRPSRAPAHPRLTDRRRASTGHRRPHRAHPPDQQRPVTDVLADFAQRSRSTAPATMLLAEPDCVAAGRRDLTNPDATEWTAAPVSDTETRRGPRSGHRGGDDPDQQPRRAGRRGDEHRAQRHPAWRRRPDNPVALYALNIGTVSGSRAHLGRWPGSHTVSGPAEGGPSRFAAGARSPPQESRASRSRSGSRSTA